MGGTRRLPVLLGALMGLAALLKGFAGNLSGAPVSVAVAADPATAATAVSVAGKAPIANVPGPTRLSEIATPADLVKALQEHGAKSARDTGETISPLFGAKSGHVIELLGQPVQVYVMPSPAAAQGADKDPAKLMVQWIAPPHFIAVGNLVITVVTPDEAMAQKIVAYVQVVQG